MFEMVSRGRTADVDDSACFKTTRLAGQIGPDLQTSDKANAKGSTETRLCG